jgi:hypothetical protein
MRTHVTIKGVAFVVLFTATLLWGCSWYGAYIRHNQEVADRFESYQLYPGYRYYTAGTLADPRAVLALKPGYQLKSTGWQPVEMTPDKLKTWVQALDKVPFADENMFPNGAQIIDDQGHIAGYYYSVWDFPIIRFSEANTLVMNKPPPNYRYYNKIRGRIGDHDDDMFDAR